MPRHRSAARPGRPGRRRAQRARRRLAVEGLDGVYVGPGDLSLSLELDAAARREELRGVLSSIISRAGAAGVPVEVHAYSGAEAAVYQLGVARDRAVDAEGRSG